MTSLKIFGQHDDQTVLQMHECMKVGPVTGAVLCADGHLGYAQPVGGVVAYDHAVSVSGVGYDIGCGNKAIQLDLKYDEIAKHLPEIESDIRGHISFGIGQKNNTRVDHELFDSPTWDDCNLGHLKELARNQLGTIGSGNHYVDLFRDEDDLVWIGVHFGSRGFGHKTATKYLKLGGGQDGINVPPTVLSLDDDLGKEYIAAMRLAGAYAYAGRDWVCETIRKIIGAGVRRTVHNHHNYAWLERHNGQDVWVVRKGATPCWPGQPGFVGGSMGDNAVIICGVDGEKSKKSLYSTVHGAGRVHGRMAAKGKKDKKTGEWKRQPLFTREQMESWLLAKGVRLYGGDVDESPMVYRRLHEVLDYHKDTIRVEHTLKPFLVFMAGEGEYDPYKD